MTVPSIWLRRIHKWVGLVIGLQFLIWAISGAAMALLDMEDVSGGPMVEHPAEPLPTTAAGWEAVQQKLAGSAVSNLAIRQLPGTTAIVATTRDGVRLFDAATGSPILIDATRASTVAAAAHPEAAPIRSAIALTELPLAVREHQLPIWQVDFDDAANSSYFISGTTGQLLERRNDSWRWWDFFWMLHNMDYAKRTSFNHPLIIIVGLAAAWLAATGFWLLFRTMWRHDFSAVRRTLKR
ncbi:PepSY domain-containing protein [Sphingomonas edaphi]|uniref:PepSY domain-containing protein n=1 Tax=Sphingomonas edaphi TaxID=2315689 RepID=A0A418Q076_9SPHN|nr:PepSY domain-containing protein [Sphingomonas edaphi]RIX29269.1 hypothetical protein D3M59_08185 [Sphingomonas edaphi]